MSDYMLTTAGVRTAYGVAVTYPTRSFQERQAEFDRWLEQVKAEAWEEGHEAAAMRIPEGVWHDTASPRPTNPYRQEKEA